MKYRIVPCILLLVTAAAAQAEPLKKEHVSADAKWLVHIDCDNLRQTQIGEFLINKFVYPKVAEATGELKFDVTNVLQRIKSLTAYGADFTKGDDANGVLVIHSDPETQKALEGVLVAQILADTDGPVQKLETDTEQALYSVANQVFISPQKGGPIVISKSQSQIEAAQELLGGKRANLTSSKSFDEFPAISNSFFFIGLADASSLPNQIPARAKVLQMADGGRMAVGEKANQVFLDLALRGKTAEVTRQIQQVIEGTIALVSLGQPDNPDLTGLAKSTKVACTDQLISISLEYPASKVIAKLDDEISSKSQKEKPGRQKAKSKGKQKQSAKSEKAAAKPEAEKEEKQ